MSCRRCRYRSNTECRRYPVPCKTSPLKTCGEFQLDNMNALIHLDRNYLHLYNDLTDERKARIKAGKRIKELNKKIKELKSKAT